MACLAGAAAAAAQSPLQRLPALLPTPWSGAVSRSLPLPEYPRPQLARRSWENLNGQWGYEGCRGPGVTPPRDGCTPPFGGDVPQTILVPFPVSSSLSGIGRMDTAGWYRRTFTVPATWSGQRVVLNVGAVSWAATVYVNRHRVATHHGDFDGFSVDITDALRPGVNQLVIGFRDAVGADGEPVGKQALGSPAGILHTPANGIWQTVWLEPVAARHLTDLELVPDLPHHRLLIRATVAGGAAGLTLAAHALGGSRTVAAASGRANRVLAVPLGARPHLWWPHDPYLYGLRVSLGDRGVVLDAATSYFGMRSVGLGTVAGATRILLNGRFVFQSGALDQGYWPDGIFTAPTDAALRFDVAGAKTLGYNMLREHAKVEPDRWYLWADRLGLLVWQDMPGASRSLDAPPSPSARAEFRRELAAIVTQRRSHPSIVTWVPFNEGWGQFDLSGITAEIRGLDPGALVDAQSGGANCCAAQETPVSDIRDTHLYTGPFSAPPDRRATVVGEYGGVLGVPAPAHRWPWRLYSVGSPIGPPFPDAYIRGVLRRQYAMLGSEMRYGGLSASVFTEYDSPEQELGIVTYDRRASTVAPSFLRTVNQRLIGASLRLGGPLPRPSRAPAAAPSGSTGWWRLTGARAGAVPDASGAGNPLALARGARFIRGPHRRGALALPGTEAVALSARPVLATAGSFTVSAWLRSDRFAQSASAVSELGPNGSVFALGAKTDRGAQGQTRAGRLAGGTTPDDVRTWWTFLGADGAGCAIAQCGVGANLRYDDGRDQVRRQSWHHVVGVVDRATLTISVYVDGQPQDVEHLDASPAATGPLVLGGGSGVFGPGSDAYFGAIADLRAYGRGLSPEEVWQLYEASLPTEP